MKNIQELFKIPLSRFVPGPYQTGSFGDQSRDLIISSHTGQLQFH